MRLDVWRLPGHRRRVRLIAATGRYPDPAVDGRERPPTTRSGPTATATFPGRLCRRFRRVIDGWCRERDVTPAPNARRRPRDRVRRHPRRSTRRQVDGWRRHGHTPTTPDAEGRLRGVVDRRRRHGKRRTAPNTERGLRRTATTGRQVDRRRRPRTGRPPNPRRGATAPTRLS